MTLKQALWEIVRDENIIITNQNIDWLLDRALKKASGDAQALKESVLERKEKLDKLGESENKSNEELFKQALVEGVNRRIDKTIEEEKQIEEMRAILCRSGAINHCEYCEDCEGIVEALYNAGYRKQSENVIGLPCKVGTTLYFLYNSPYADKPDLTPRIYKTADWYFEIDKTGIVINTSWIHSFNKKYDYHLGETVFLSKEEAEAKMKGGEE